MATQYQRELTAEFKEHREKYGYRFPSKEVLQAIDAVLIEEAKERLKAQQKKEI